MPTKAELESQLKKLRLTDFDTLLTEHAQSHGFPPSFFFAIASRETNCTNKLGDFHHGNFHGVGIVQIDVQHEIARQARDSGSWETTPEPLIEFGAQMLETNIKHAAKVFPDLSPQKHLKIAASGYNCGMKNAIFGAKQGDSDKRTTGHNYGRDVIARMGIFEELLAEGDETPNDGS